MKSSKSINVSPKKAAKIKALLKQIDSIIAHALKLEETFNDKLDKVHPEYRQSALNLIHYQALRSHDLHELQTGLGSIGLSRLARAQSHVLRSLYFNRELLKLFLGKKMSFSREGISYKKADRILKKNAKALMGYRSKGRRTRIMVTLPSAAANDFHLVKDMIANGMNCARINCAHDDKTAWLQMIRHVRMASKQLNNICKVAMDLAGPKIRTGRMAPGPKILKLRPRKDKRGKITKPLPILFSDHKVVVEGISVVPLSREDIQKLKEGDVLMFSDARDKKRKIQIIDKHKNGFSAICFKTTYLETDMSLVIKRGNSNDSVVKVGQLAPLELSILLYKGDTLRVDKSPFEGEPALYDKDGGLVEVAHISCTAPEIFNDVKKGEPVLFDDGKIGGFIKSIHKEYLEIEINHALKKGSKLKADKGMNFPLTNLSISGLTAKDILDLDFVAAHADVVNMSFVNSADDVHQLLAEINKRKAGNGLGIVLKIETQQGFNNLTPILLTAMQNYPIGVMIARGDLAVECGWKNIGRIQMEILSICLAAHVTDIWATQVLENLAKKGLPSRSEITDVVEAQQADCVMLNKGPYILESIKLLDSILRNMEPYREKNIVFSPALS